MADTARLRLPTIAASQAQKHVTHNEALVVVDSLVQASVLGFATAPTGGEAEGDCYIVEATATGAFTGWEGRIARLQDGAWVSFLPGQGDGNGWRVWNQDDELLYVFDGAGTWTALAAGAVAAQIAFTPAGGVAATDVQAAIEELDSEKASTAYVDGIAANLGKRGRVRAATTADITIATALNDGDALDGVTLAAGDLVLVKDQSATGENGVYVVGATPVRAAEFDSYDEHPGSLLAVAEGSTNADTLWLCTSNAGGTLDSTAIAFSTVSAGAVASVFGRTGTVAAAASDYDASQVDNDSGVSGATVAAALDALDAGKQAALGFTPREVLGAHRTYYVRTDGSDSNTGLVDSAGGAFLTIGKAVAVVSALDLSIYNVTIQVRDGTYSEGVIGLGPLTGSGTVTIRGNTSTPGNVILNPSSTYVFLVTGNGWTVDAMRFNRASGTSISVFRVYTSYVTIDDCEFGDGFSYAHLLVDALSYVLLSGATIVDGDCPRFANVSLNAVLSKVSAATITMVGTPAFSTAFLVATGGAVVSFGGAGTITGAATGKRYDATLNAVVTYSSGVANLPGDVAGTTSTGGQAA